MVAPRATRSRRIALATIAAGVVAALALARYVAPGDKYEYADAYFEPEAVTTDRDSTAPAIASVPAKPSAPSSATAAASATMAAVASSVRPMAANQAVAEAAGRRPGRRTNTVVEADAATTVAMPAVERREPEEPMATAADAGATEIAPFPAAPATAAVDEVTITGCLEIDKNEDRFRLADTEGVSAPKARSWRSGFLRKRAAPIDLVGSTDALAFHRQVGQRIAATGVLTSRTLKVSSVRMVSPSCN